MLMIEVNVYFFVYELQLYWTTFDVSTNHRLGPDPVPWQTQALSPGWGRFSGVTFVEWVGG